MNQKKKRFLKIAALAGCILLGVGIVISGAGYLAMGMTLSAFAVPRGAAEEPVTLCYPESEVEAIEVHGTLGNVTIRGAKTDASQDVEVRAVKSMYQVYAQNGLLMVMPQDTAVGDSGWKWYQLFNFSQEGDWSVEITVPRKLLNSVVVETSLGSGELSNLEAGQVTVECDSGNVTLKQVKALESLTVTQSMGTLDLEDCAGKNFTLENSMGRMGISGCEFGISQVANESGDVTVENSSFQSLDATTSMGACTLKQVTVAEEVECSTGMGDVKVEELDSLDIILSTDSGGITGTIRGQEKDYQITTDTGAGSSNLRDQLSDGRGKLRATTGMGDINLRFTQ